MGWRVGPRESLFLSLITRKEAGRKVLASLAPSIVNAAFQFASPRQPRVLKGKDPNVELHICLMGLLTADGL